MTEQTDVKFTNIGNDEEETFVPEAAVTIINNLAGYAHRVLTGYAKAFGQELEAWDKLSKKEQQHIIGRVAHFMTYPDSDAGAPHEAWRMRLALNGWSLGNKLDAARKTRPDLCYFSQLPQEQQAADHIIKAIVHEAFSI